MQNLKIVPYIPLENIDFPYDTIWEINQASFKEVEFIDGKMTFFITNCDFKKILICNFENIDFKDITLAFDSCLINEFIINDINSENISIFFFNCIINGRIESDKIKSISINNCIIDSSLFLIKQNFIYISYTETNIFPKIWDKFFQRIGGNFLKIIEVQQSYFIYDSKNINFNTFEEKENQGKLYRNRFHTDDNYKIGYYLTESQKKLFNINIFIKYSPQVEDSETTIRDSFFNNLEISGFTKGKLSIENTRIENWYIRNFSSQSEINFYNISPLKLKDGESKIEIHRSNLDKSWFDNIDFSKYNIISFYRTKFGKSTFTSCNFPIDSIGFEKFKSLNNIHYPDKKSDNYYKDQYEIFLQLKVLLESTGNTYESQKLHAISYDALKKIKQISTWDKAILWINSQSNNHGLSAQRPFFLFFFSSIILYILYLYSLGRIFNTNHIDCSLIGYYFSFIDITHRVDFLVDKREFNWASLTIDFFSKITLGFFIYQFIAAFRKYGKK